MFLIFIITSILCTNSYAFECQGDCKTRWFDRDNPSGNGDYEDLVNLRKEYPDQICNNPTACEVETTSGIPASSSGDNVSGCSISTGFTCVNKEQKDGSCEDYRIRFTCAESFCKCNCKTQWFDRDNPSGNGDYEDLVNLRKEYPDQICNNPTACEVETTSGIPASSSGDNVSDCSISTGFTCVNKEQKDGRCEDYRIRFTCPESFCNCKTQWFDRDNPSGNGDYEDLVNLRKEYPDQICNNPTACEVETTSGIPASSSGDNVPECSISSGFTCVNKKQKDGRCEDYRIRFTCPESFCNCKTRWFDRDNPSGNGDYEDLVNLRKEYPDQICNNPTACEVETTSGIPASSSGDNISECSVSTGFTCVNNDQGDRSCEDYRIRFTCPESFCNCKTRWFDRDNPSGNGDYEDLVNLRKEYPDQICNNPTACEVETTSGIPASSSGDIVAECSISSGFTCVNKEQKDRSCEDYRIRFTCPESFCNCKTRWFDRDNPSGNGDYEDLVNLRKEYPDQICNNPTACEVETTSGIPASSSGDIVAECSISSGFTCVNKEQKDGSCEDYRIRFTCPESFCNKKTQWFDRDNPSGNGDYEDLVNLRKEYPGQICSDPIACEVQTVSGKPASSTNDVISECSTLTGFACVNADQEFRICEDYKIRFTCP
ncbi:mucin-5AC isoform X2 [Heptranchias perlo]|uniref:mucin-5AC isoform X2 n=1 Tax=Heptranchias perlo TaxID=212740 RepID=UPI0035593CF3